MKPTVTVDLEDYRVKEAFAKAALEKKVLLTYWNEQMFHYFFPTEKDLIKFKADKIAELEQTIKQKEDNANEWYKNWRSLSDIYIRKDNTRVVETDPYSIILAIVISGLVGIGIGLIL